VNKKIMIIGAGLSGATLARVLAERGFEIYIYEQEKVVGGMAADKNELRSYPVGIKGPHIFHTNNEKVFQFISRFCELDNYIHKVKSVTEIGILPWPINFTTIKEIFGTSTCTEGLRKWRVDIKETKSKIGKPTTFIKKAKCEVGKKVYEIMIENYSKHQWGNEYQKLPASLFNRIRVVFSTNDNFFDDKYQGMPIGGYTKLVENILDHKNINLFTSSKILFEDYEKYIYKNKFILSTAKPNEISDGRFGILPYRELNFMDATSTLKSRLDDEVFKNIAVINLAKKHAKFTRATNYKKLYSINTNEKDIIMAEYASKEGGVSCYPIMTSYNVECSAKYINYLQKLGIYSFGRLGSYKYINMDEAILASMDLDETVW